VKHALPARRNPINELFTNAKIAEDDIENIFDVDATGQPAKRRRGRAQFLGDQLFAIAPVCGLSQCTIKRRYGVLKGTVMARSGHDPRLGRRKIPAGKFGKIPDQRLYPFPICC
jgi:hypothetical protein